MNNDSTTWADWLAAIVIGIVLGALAGAGF
jgi:uncharacterized membrane-anchored protein YhcB (DUF1043 family)